MKIYILGLGAGNLDLVSKKAYELLMDKKIQKIFRTEKHEIITQLKKQNVKFESMDYIYEKEDTFEQVYENISNIVIQYATKHQNIIYAVPGNPFVMEDTTNKIITKANNIGIKIEIVPSVSFIDASICSIRKDPTKKLYITDIFNIDKNRINPKDNILISQVYDRFKASELKLDLMEKYDDEQEIYIIKSAGNTNEEIKKVKLFEMDYTDNKYDHLTSIYIDSVENEKYKDITNLRNKIKNYSKTKDYKQLLEEQNVDLLSEIKTYIKEENYPKIENFVKNRIFQAFVLIDFIEKENFSTYDEIIDNLVNSID